MLSSSQADLITPENRRTGIGRFSWLALAIGLLILLLPFSATFQHGGGLMDEGMLLVYPEMIQRGAIPYRDFETFYGPANPYLLAAVYSVFGTTIEVERTVGLLYRGLILIALFGLTRRWGTPIATGCLLLSGFLLLPLGVIAYAWLGALACALSFIWAMAGPRSSRECFIGGLLAGLALAFRVDVAPAVALAAGVLLWPLSPAQRLRFAYGAALGLIPFAILFLLVGPEQMFNNIFLYPVIRSGPGRRLPLFSAEPFLVRLFFLQVLAAAANIIGAILAVRARPEEWRNRVLLALALFGAGVMSQAWQRLDLPHLLFVAFLVIGILPLTLFSLASLWSGDRRQVWLAPGAALLVAAMVCAIASPLPECAVAAFREALQTTPTGSVFVQQGQRSFPVGSAARVVSIGRMLDELERRSKPGERLFVGPADLRRTNYNDTYIYHLMPKLTPATYFLEMNPLSANRPGSRLAADVRSADWLVLNRAWDFWREPNSSTEYASGAPNAVVQEQFDLVGEFGSYLLFRRKSQDVRTS
jgi:hypothetical protein